MNIINNHQLKEWRVDFSQLDLNKKKRRNKSKLQDFFEKSMIYPYWWRNYWWWGYRNNKKNYIYKLYFWANKERHKMDMAIYINKDGTPSNFQKERSEIFKLNPYYYVPFYKKPLVILMDKLRGKIYRE